MKEEGLTKEGFYDDYFYTLEQKKVYEMGRDLSGEVVGGDLRLSQVTASAAEVVDSARRGIFDPEVIDSVWDDYHSLEVELVDVRMALLEVARLQMQQSELEQSSRANTIEFGRPAVSSALQAAA